MMLDGKREPLNAFLSTLINKNNLTSIVKLILN
jgi:hypothetical protein